MNTTHVQTCITRATLPLTICASTHCRLIGTTDGTFPDFGHHSEREMGGLWMHPIKLLDGFWLRFHDRDAANVDTWTLADECRQEMTGNSFLYTHRLGHTPVTIKREQLAPDSSPGLIVTYTFHNHGDGTRRIEAEWRLRTDLYPCWYTLDTGARACGTDTGEWDEANAVFTARDSLNDWFMTAQSVPAPDAFAQGNLWTPQGSGQGTVASFTWRFSLAPHAEETLRLYITGSAASAEEVQARLQALLEDSGARQAKEKHMHEVLACSVLETGNELLDTVWPWVKAHTEWLTVDAGSYGRGMAAGLPEYPWWFGCDSCYSIQGLLCTGRFELAADNLRLLARYSEQINGNGRIVHEITPYGLCPNPGNTQETAHYVTAVWHYWQWTADLALVRDLLPLLRKSMAWLTSMDEDGDGLPSGYGIIEIRGLNAEMIDTAVYTSQAWGCFAEMLEACGADTAEIKAAQERHRQIRKTLNTVLWDEKAGSFCDACADPAFVRQRRGEILAHRPMPFSAEEEAAFSAMLDEKARCGSETGFLINRNWTIATPVETGEAEADKARKALETLWSPDLIGPWGVYLSALDDRMMTISTGCFAVAFARWGQPERALDLLLRLCATFGKGGPGMLSEMSPDDGCSVQGWTSYALFTPVVRHLFGVQPGGHKPLRLAPCMPATWKDVSLKHVRLPGGWLDLRWQAENDRAMLTLRADHPLHLLLEPSGFRCGEHDIRLHALRPVTLTLIRTDG